MPLERRSDERLLLRFWSGAQKAKAATPERSVGGPFEHPLGALKGRARHSRARRWFNPASLPLAAVAALRPKLLPFAQLLRRELVHGPVIVVATVNRGAVEVSKPIDDHPVVSKRAVWRTLEGMNNTLHPLTAANRS